MESLTADIILEFCRLDGRKVRYISEEFGYIVAHCEPWGTQKANSLEQLLGFFYSSKSAAEAKQYLVNQGINLDEIPVY